jgi:hypothetical protein
MVAARQNPFRFDRTAHGQLAQQTACWLVVLDAAGVRRDSSSPYC